MIITFGKYRGESVQALEDIHYLHWMFKGGLYGKKRPVSLVRIGSKLHEAVRDRLIELKELVWDNNQWMPVKLSDHISEAVRIKQESEHMFTLGDKVELEVKIREITGFNTRFGWMFVTIMHSGSNVVIYKGKDLCVNEGDSIKLKGTVKEHLEYRGAKQTRLQRITIL